MQLRLLILLACLFGFSLSHAGLATTSVQAGTALLNRVSSADADLTWRPRADLPSARSQFVLVPAGDGTILAIGGVFPIHPVMSGYTVEATVDVYNPSTDLWSSRASMSVPRTDFCAVLGPDGKVYAFGGRTRTRNVDFAPVASVEAYDPSTNIWRPRAPMPVARRGCGVAVANGKIYVVGGLVEGYTSNAVDEYDPSTNSWTARAPMPTPRTKLGVISAPNGKIYAIGGQNADIGAGSVVEEYDSATDTWTVQPPMPTPRSDLVTVLGSDGLIYALGGYSDRGYLTTVEAFRAETKQWTVKQPFPQLRVGFGAAWLGRSVFVAGGYYRDRYLASVEEGTLTLDWIYLPVVRR